MQERRKHRRKLVSSRVKISHPRFGSVHTLTRDISDGGVLILVNDNAIDIRINDEVQLVFLDSAEQDIIFNMDVVRINEPGIGMKFLNYEKEGGVYPISDLREVWEKQK